MRASFAGALLVLGLAACTSARTSESDRANLRARLENKEREAEVPGPRSPQQVAAMRQDAAEIAATVDSLCLGVPIHVAPVRS